MSSLGVVTRGLPLESLSFVLGSLNITLLQLCNALPWTTTCPRYPAFDVSATSIPIDHFLSFLCNRGIVLMFLFSIAVSLNCHIRYYKWATGLYGDTCTEIPWKTKDTWFWILARKTHIGECMGLVLYKPICCFRGQSLDKFENLGWQLFLESEFISKFSNLI